MDSHADHRNEKTRSSLDADAETKPDVQPDISPSLFETYVPEADRQPRDSTTPEQLVDHPRYTILQNIALGGMGALYLAEHKLMQRMVVIKTLRCDRSVNNADVLRQRFLREMRAMAMLSHPNIAVIHDAEDADGLLFLAMEHIEGPDFRQLVHRKGPLSLNHACDLIRQVATGLTHAHTHGIIHRDIKPANLMLTDEGATIPNIVKILDFGLARLLQDTGNWMGTPSGFGLGTFGYMAPEQAADARTAGIQADVFSLGCTFYFLLTGQVPLQGRPVDVAMGNVEVVPLLERRPDLPHEFASVVEKMMSKDAHERYDDCKTVAKSIDAWCS